MNGFRFLAWCSFIKSLDFCSVDLIDWNVSSIKIKNSILKHFLNPKKIMFTPWLHRFVVILTFAIKFFLNTKSYNNILNIENKCNNICITLLLQPCFQLFTILFAPFIVRFFASVFQFFAFAWALHISLFAL